MACQAVPGRAHSATATTGRRHASNHHDVSFHLLRRFRSLDISGAERIFLPNVETILGEERSSNSYYETICRWMCRFELHIKLAEKLVTSLPKEPFSGHKDSLSQIRLSKKIASKLFHCLFWRRSNRRWLRCTW